MRWFHHDTEAHSNVKIQLLIEKEGLAGAGAFWSLLEEIGLQSSTFRLKVDVPRGFWARSVARVGNLLAREVRRDAPPWELPVMALNVMARRYRTRPSTLRRIIRTCVSVGLFDREEWDRWGVLYSRGFERRADAYTKRALRGSRRTEESVRTVCAHSPELVEHCAKSSPSEQDREQQIEIYKNRTAEQDAEPKIGSRGAEAAPKRSVFKIGGGGEADMDRLYGVFIGRINGFLGDWAARHGGSVPWCPEDEHLRSLWRVALRIAPEGGNRREQVERGIDLVLGAVRNMFDESTRREIRSPPAYLSASLLGTHGGTRPWVK
jgi:hypothetical protein